MARILIAEDDTRIQLLCSMVLEEEGFEVDVVMRGDEALEKLQRGSFDALLLDILMPGKDGLEVCREVKSNPATRNIPVVVMSARSDRLYRAMAYADALVQKPFNIDRLITTIRQVLPAG